MSEERDKLTPLWGRCSECGHRWPVVFLPMEIERAGMLMQSAACPYGCDGCVLLAKAPEE